MANVSQTAEPTIAFASKLDCDICHEQKCPSEFTRAFLYKLLERCSQVHGMQSLRVVDSSIFPTIPNGNLNAPTIMVAEKAADIILGNKPLAHTGVDVVNATDWQTSQRNKTL